MIPVVAERADELKQLCLRYSVQRLDLFGSAVTGEYRPEESDLDFVVGSSFSRSLSAHMPTPTSACWKLWSSFSGGPWT